MPEVPKFLMEHFKRAVRVYLYTLGRAATMSELYERDLWAITKNHLSGAKETANNYWLLAGVWRAHWEWQPSWKVALQKSLFIVMDRIPYFKAQDLKNCRGLTQILYCALTPSATDPKRDSHRRHLRGQWHLWDQSLYNTSVVYWWWEEIFHDA